MFLLLFSATVKRRCGGTSPTATPMNEPLTSPAERGVSVGTLAGGHSRLPWIVLENAHGTLVRTVAL
jgi:hypothetical protein